MYEVEVKLPCDHAVVRPRLLDRGFEPISTVTETDRYFDSPLRSFAETDEALRLRTADETGEETSTAELTYKGPRLAGLAKRRFERGCSVDDAAGAIAILEALDFNHVATVEKRRERFRRRDLTATLDEVTDLGEFLELERMVESDELDGIGGELERVVTELELSPGRAIEETYLELLLDDNSQ